MATTSEVAAKCKACTQYKGDRAQCAALRGDVCSSLAAGEQAARKKGVDHVNHP